MNKFLEDEIFCEIFKEFFNNYTCIRCILLYFKINEIEMY